MTTASQTVSVVIPCYGRQPMLARALSSVASQSLTPLEVIVVDDASPAPIVLPDLGGLPFPVKLIRLDRNGGGGVARNAGVVAARGEIIAFLDSDDAFAPDYLAIIDRHWGAADAALGLLATGFHWCDAELARYRTQICKRRVVDRASLLNNGNMIGGCSVFSVRRAAFLSVGGFPALRASQDWGLLLAMASRYRIETLDRALVLYASPTFNATSITRSARRGALAVLKIYQLYAGEQRRCHGLRATLTAYHLARGGRMGPARRSLAYAVFKNGHFNALSVKTILLLAAPAALRARVRSATHALIQGVARAPKPSPKSEAVAPRPAQARP